MIIFTNKIVIEAYYDPLVDFIHFSCSRESSEVRKSLFFADPKTTAPIAPPLKKVHEKSPGLSSPMGYLDKILPGAYSTLSVTLSGFKQFLGPILTKL